LLLFCLHNFSGALPITGICPPQLLKLGRYVALLRQDRLSAPSKRQGMPGFLLQEAQSLADTVLRRVYNPWRTFLK